MWPARPAACDLLSFTLVLCHALSLSFSPSPPAHPVRVLVARLVLDPCALVTAGRFVRDSPRVHIHAKASAQDYGNACGVATYVMDRCTSLR